MKYVIVHYNVAGDLWRSSKKSRRTLYFVRTNKKEMVRNLLLSQAKIFDTAKEAEECKNLEALLSEAHILPVSKKELFLSRLKGE